MDYHEIWKIGISGKAMTRPVFWRPFPKLRVRLFF